jgi:hypothetical protein
MRSKNSVYPTSGMNHHVNRLIIVGDLDDSFWRQFFVIMRQFSGRHQFFSLGQGHLHTYKTVPVRPPSSNFNEMATKVPDGALKAAPLFDLGRAKVHRSDPTRPTTAVLICPRV